MGTVERKNLAECIIERRNKMENYNKIIEMDNITIQDCIDMYDKKGMRAIIDNGRVINFEKEDE